MPNHVRGEEAVHHLVILNPTAGKGTASEKEPRLRRLLDKQQIEYELVHTEGPMHAAELVREASRGFDVVVAAGGDGTCNEIVNGLMTIEDRTDRPALGVLCIGRGNDFAHAAGIPHSLEPGIRALAAGNRRLLDVGRLSGCGPRDPRYFCNGLGIGFDTIVGLEAERMKRVGGFLGYVLGALKTIARFPEAPFVRLQSKELSLQQEATQISIMIGMRMGGAFLMCPRSLPDDGALDLCVAGRVSRLRMVQLFFKFLKGTQEGQPEVATGRATRFEVEAERGALLVHADGETICIDGSRLVAECVPGALQVVTAAEPSSAGAEQQRASRPALRSYQR